VRNIIQVGRNHTVEQISSRKADIIKLKYHKNVQTSYSRTDIKLVLVGNMQLMSCMNKKSADLSSNVYYTSVVASKIKCDQHSLGEPSLLTGRGEGGERGRYVAEIYYFYKLPTCGISAQLADVS
jgi:hypothetical protein